MHFLYILYSKKIGQYYSGQTADIENRIEKHNNGYSRATKRGVPWELKKAIPFKTKRDAIRAENWIKQMKSREVIERVINGEIDLDEIVKNL